MTTGAVRRGVSVPLSLEAGVVMERDCTTVCACACAAMTAVSDASGFGRLPVGEPMTAGVDAGAESDDPSGRAVTGGASMMRVFADSAATAARAAASAVSRATEVGTGSARSPRVRLRVVSGISAGATGSSLSTGAGASSGGTGTPVTRERGASTGAAFDVVDVLNVGRVAATPDARTGEVTLLAVEAASAAGASELAAPRSPGMSGALPSVVAGVPRGESFSSACFEVVTAAGVITDEDPPRRRTRCSAIGADDWLTASCRIAETSVSVSGA